jgi:YggT family protein
MHNNDGLHDSPPVNIIAASDNSKIIKSISGPALLMAVALISPSIALADTNPDVVAITIVRPTLDVLVNVLSFLFLCRTIISWYPKTDLTKLPYSAAVWPTEPLLVPVRGLIPPAFGVDISAIVWIMLLQFVREITIGQQGILTLLENS